MILFSWENSFWCTKLGLHWKIPHMSLVACSSGDVPYFFYFLLFIYLFWYFLGCQMYSQCAPYLRHRFRKENRNTMGGMLCYNSCSWLWREWATMVPYNLQKRTEWQNLFLEMYRVICSINVPMKLNCSVNLICCSLNVWFYCIWHFIIFFWLGINTF